MKERSEQYRKVIAKYVPSEYVDDIIHLLLSHPVVFKVVKPRKTKLGDFRAGHKGSKHRITINGDLNPYSFLITTVHEFAHLVTFENHGSRVAPHGTEWKNIYSELMLPIVNKGHLPQDVEDALLKSLVKVKASSCSDTNLHRTLLKYSPQKGNVTVLESLEKNSTFALNGKTFVKGKLRRTRYLCTDITTKRQYLVSGLAEVTEIKDEE